MLDRGGLADNAPHPVLLERCDIYRDLWRKVSVMSTHLRVRFGLSPGDRVAFAMTNCVEAIEVMVTPSG